jgi:hypothetical protein
MPFRPLSTAILVCDRILTEGDGVMSAIRLVDVFFVPENPTEGAMVSLQVLIVLKSYPSEEVHRLTFRHEKPDGDIAGFGGTTEFQVRPFRLDASVPTGLNVQIEAPIDARSVGTHSFQALVDGEEVARCYFTLMRRASESA